MSVNTKQAQRRALRFGSVSDIRAELDRLEAAHHASADGAGVRSAGNWSPGQNFAHLAEWVERYENKDFPPIPWYIRPVGRVLKGRILTKGFPAGLPGPGGKPQVLPETSFEDGLARFRPKLDVLESQDLSHKNPFLGYLSRKQAVALHLRHAELHLGFLHPASLPANGAAS